MKNQYCINPECNNSINEIDHFNGRPKQYCDDKCKQHTNYLRIRVQKIKAKISMKVRIK